MKRSFHLYKHYISINIRSIMQYKVSFVLTVIGQFLVSFNVFLGIYFMFCRFSQVKGFTYEEVLLSFSIILMEFSIAECYARGFDTFSGIIRKGEFDRIMVRPRSTILQVLGAKFELTRIGRLIQAIVMLLYVITTSTIEWNFSKALTVIFMLIGGTVVFTGIFLIYASICFFTIDNLEFMNVFTDGAREFGRYPIGIYGKRVLQFATFVIPYALIQYYPLLYLLDRRTDPIYMFLPLIAILFLIPCYALWRIGVRHYTSCGS